MLVAVACGGRKTSARVLRYRLVFIFKYYVLLYLITKNFESYEGQFIRNQLIWPRKKKKKKHISAIFIFVCVSIVLSFHSFENLFNFTFSAAWRP